MTRLPDGPYRLHAWTARVPAPGFSTVPYEVVRENVPSDAAAIELKLVSRIPKGGLRRAFEGTVRDAKTDRPVRNFRAFLGDADGPNYATRVSPATFRFEAPPSGTWTLHVRAEGYAWFERAGIEIDADRVPAVLDVALERGATVHGVVRGLSEADLSHSIFELHVEGEHEGPRSQVKRDGAYLVRGVGPGPYFPFVYDNRGNPPFEGGLPPWIPDDGHPLDVAASAADVPLDVHFVRAGRLLVHIGWKSEAPRSGTAGDSAQTPRVLEIRDANSALVRQWRGALPGSPLRPDAPIFLLPGRYSVRLTVPGREPFEREVAINSGGTAAVTFELP
ncbi:MAG: carboxypeptidase regulatory-like domain-containing protein [Planctomycetes bacterium]|nr:carboxypeptidase regulatory-like domain-containing protein [Planctomycetota bacterium]